MSFLGNIAPVLGGTAGFFMGGPAGAAIGAGIGANFSGQESANQQNRDLYFDQKEYNRQMSATAHRREVDDLIAAGLNPTLSAGGPGAGVPGINPPSMQAPQIDLPAFMQIQTLGLEKEKLNIDQQRVGIEAAKLGLGESKASADVAKTMSEVEINKMKKVLMQKGMIKAELEGGVSELLHEFMRYMKKSYNNMHRPPNINYFNRRP